MVKETLQTLQDDDKTHTKECSNLHVELQSGPAQNISRFQKVVKQTAVPLRAAALELKQAGRKHANYLIAASGCEA